MLEDVVEALDPTNMILFSFTLPPEGREVFGVLALTKSYSSGSSKVDEESESESNADRCRSRLSRSS